MNCVKHVTGDEKYEWLILNVVIRISNIGVGIVCWARLSGQFLECGICIFGIAIQFQFRMIG